MRDVIAGLGIVLVLAVFAAYLIMRSHSVAGSSLYHPPGWRRGLLMWHRPRWMSERQARRAVLRRYFRQMRTARRQRPTRRERDEL